MSSFDSIAFRSSDDAATFAALLPASVDYEWEIGSEYPYAKQIGTHEITSRHLCRHQDIVNMMSDLKDQKSRKKANKEALTNYREACNEVEKASAGVWDNWRHCRGRQREVATIATTLEDYKSLCDGDAVLANKFLKKAYSVDELEFFSEWTSPEKAEASVR